MDQSTGSFEVRDQNGQPEKSILKGATVINPRFYETAVRVRLIQ